jgi:MFS family permease
MGLLGVALVAAFCVVETKVAEPIIPLKLFKNRTFSTASGVGFIIGFAMFAALIYLPLYLQTVHGATPTASGLELLPLVAGMLCTFIVSGRLVTRTGRYKIFPIVGSAVLTGGLALLSRLGPHTTFSVTAVYMFVVGLGVGLVMQVLVVAVQNSVPYSELGVATSTATFFRTIGGAFGVSALGAVFDSRLLGSLSTHASPAELKLISGGSVTANPAQIDHLPAAQHIVFVNAFSHALQDVFLVAVPFAALAFVLSWIMKEIPLRTTAPAPEPDIEGTDNEEPTVLPSNFAKL